MVNSIDYLGICLDNHFTWAPQTVKCTNILVQRAGAITRLLSKSPIVPLSPVIELYRAKAQSAVLYGAEIWGYINFNTIAVKENQFFRILCGLPRHCPLIPLFYDLAFKQSRHLAPLKPLIY